MKHCTVPGVNMNAEIVHSQYKNLVAIMAELYVLNQERAIKLSLTDHIIELCTQTKKFFRDIEEYAGVKKYAGWERYNMIHQKLLIELYGYVEEFLKYHRVMSGDFIYFLKQYLTLHINYIDIIYGATKQDLEQAS